MVAQNAIFTWRIGSPFNMWFLEPPSLQPKWIFITNVSDIGSLSKALLNPNRCKYTA